MHTSKRDKDSMNIEPYTSDASRNTRSYLEKIMGEMSKTSAMKQIIIGSTSGWYKKFYYLLFIIYEFILYNYYIYYY